MMGPLYRSESCPADRRLTFWNGHAGRIEVVAGQGEVQVPALGEGRSARLIRPATMSGSHGRMMPLASSRSRQVRTVHSDRPV